MRIQPRLIESNPLLEETRNQTAVMCGPWCIAWSLLIWGTIKSIISAFLRTLAFNPR